MTHTTSFNKKVVKSRFKALRSAVLIGLCMLGLFLFPDKVLSATIFTDYFNSYTDGNLDQQGFWVDVGFDEDFQVQGTDTFEGLKAIACLGNESCADEKSGAETPTGSTTFAVKLADNVPAQLEGIGVWFEDDGVSIFKIELATRENDIEIWLYGGDALGIYKWKDYDWTDDWIVIQAEWNYDTQQWRAGHGGTWSDWQNAYLNRNWLGIDVIEISSNAGVSSRFFDTISERPTCSSANCKACFNYDACITADCLWYFSIYLQTHYCVQPYELDPDECGPFFKCQYCLTQGLCEAETGFCEWADIGFGEKCYMFEPTIPPGQEEWQVPDLEDCGELTGVEMWLCEIKNDILGVFMPSQTKITALYQTIGAFKEKFPFNYAESLRSFFEDIAESLDEEKAIPIKILGQESNVSFIFWEEETTIGGVVESFKNILFDFTTLIVLLGFFVWLISLIKRFF